MYNSGKEKPPEYFKAILPYCATEKQKQVISQLTKTPNTGKAALALGISRVSVKKISARVGQMAAAQENPHSGHQAPPGFMIDRVSDFYKHETGEITHSWYIQRRDKEADQFQLLTEACQDAFSNITPAARIKCPKRSEKNLMNVLPMGDPHIGMYAYHLEAGKDFDCDIAERELSGAIEYLIDKLPPAETCLILNLGDFFHSDGDHNRTKSGNVLDADGRWSRVLRIGISIMNAAVTMALKKHKRVIVKNIKGNHDTTTSQVLSVAMEFAFSNNPRVTILPAENPFLFHQFGKVMIASTHGDLVKPNKGPEVAANYAAEMWGSTIYRYFYFGHFHHEHRQEIGGMTTEIFNTMASQDAWHYASGYKSQQNMKGLVLDADFGEVERYTFDVRRLNQ